MTSCVWMFAVLWKTGCFRFVFTDVGKTMVCSMDLDFRMKLWPKLSKVSKVSQKNPDTLKMFDFNTFISLCCCD